MTASQLFECPPVLLIIFKRPETTRQVMAAIRGARPQKLYVAADGPRVDRGGEAAACAATRQVAMEVDWPCEVFTLFQDKNLGCKSGPVTAIDWFFEHEAEGIILEDDVVAGQSFFPYCGELLSRYRDDMRVGAIAGANLAISSDLDTSYYFSRLANIWGWATWRRAWRYYDRKMMKWDSFKKQKGFNRLMLDGSFEKHFSTSFESVARGAIESAWDYQWIFSLLSQNTFAIVPKVNMVKNVGFGAGATHTMDTSSVMANLKICETSFPLSHPALFIPRSDKDLIAIKNMQISLSNKILSKIKRMSSRLLKLINRDR